MKLTGIILLAGFLQVSARTTAQTVTYAAKGAPLTQVLAAIEQQTGFHLFYDDADLADSKPVTVQLKGVLLPQALEAVLAGQSLRFEILGNTISIAKKQTAPLQQVQGPTPGDIHGRVTDSTGAPLAFVNIMVKGTSKGTMTNEKGEFILKGVSTGAVLVFSNVGYESQEIRLGEREDVRVLLKASAASMQDVVVNKGYYSTRQVLNTGNVTTVKGEDIAKQPVSNPLAALEGRVPGLLINQNTGVFGGSFGVQIRGQSSISNGNDPLYVVDGVPYPTGALYNLNSIGIGGSTLDYINPSDIESIDVLKDADATAIYGSRGANGVILITTKKGKAGKTKVDINMYSGSGKVTRFMKLMNTPQYLSMRREAFANDGVTPTMDNAKDLLFWDTTRYTDWQKELIGGTARTTDVQGSVSGGSANAQYLLGGGYHRETSVFPGSPVYQKASLHATINSSSDDQRFKVQFKGDYVANDTRNIEMDLTGTAIGLAPNAPALYNPDGSLNWAPVTAGQPGTFQNPLAFSFNRYNGRIYNLVGNVTLSYLLFRGLELRTSLGYVNMHKDENEIYPTTTADPGSPIIPQGRSEFNNSNNRTWIVEPQVNYKLNIGKGMLSALVGATVLRTNNDALALAASGFTSDALLTNIKAATSLSVTTQGITQYKYGAVFGAINYNLKDEYVINLTARRDGTSRFGPEKQFANFGAAGATWIFTKEASVQRSLPFLSLGKIRASYGTTGSDQVPDYQFLDLYSTSYWSYQNTQTLNPTGLPTPDLAWEVNKKLEAGLELGFFHDRIGLNASVYRNRSSNQLLYYQLSAVTGFPSIQTNLAALNQNTGVELMLNSTNVKSRHFSWSSSFNITIPKNKLVAFPGLATSSYSNQYIIGQSLSINKRFHFLGVDPQTGVYQYASRQGQSTFDPITPDDKTVIFDYLKGYYYGGLSNNFQYRGFSLDVFFQFTHRQNTPYLFTFVPGYVGINQPVGVLNHWTKTGDAATFQRFTQKTNGPAFNSYRNYFPDSDGNGMDGSFIRLKNVAFSYTLPGRLTKKINIQNCRFYFQGQNLLTFTKYIGGDPENGGNSLPPLRVLTAGLQITL